MKGSTMKKFPRYLAASVVFQVIGWVAFALGLPSWYVSLCFLLSAVHLVLNMKKEHFA